MAAHSENSMITIQPLSRSKNINNNSNKCNEYDGEPILFEAMCDTDRLKAEVKVHFCTAPLQTFYTGAGALVVLCMWAASFPLGCYCGKRVANSWRLFLTSSRIYYQRKNECCLCHSCHDDMYIDLSDINTIWVQSAAVNTGYCGTAELPTTVAVELKPGHREELLRHWYFTEGVFGCCKNHDNRVFKLSFSHCANAEEFVQAVEQQMQAN